MVRVMQGLTTAAPVLKTMARISARGRKLRNPYTQHGAGAAALSNGRAGRVHFSFRIGPVPPAARCSSW